MNRRDRNLSLACRLIWIAGVVASLPVHAERAPERLTQPGHLRIYFETGARLNCFCGCHGTVGDCLHVDSGCFAVQARRFIETRVLEGMQSDEIVAGFVSGFGERVRADPQLAELQTTGHAGLVQGFVRGFGTTILNREPSPWPMYILGAAAIALFSALVIYLVRAPRRRRQTAGQDPAPRAGETGSAANGQAADTQTESGLQARIDAALDSLER